jgi:DNA helicase-2/ATP-dependent DNA helicase PcrA
VVSRSGLEDLYADQQQSDGTAIENINELISSAAQYDQENPEGDLEDYLQQTALVSDVDALDAESGAVALMTMHAAKGLEFPVAFMVGLEDGLLPHRRSNEDVADTEEERRLCFVGITRAEKELTLSYARYRQFRGTTSRTVPSPFLAELPCDSVRLIDCGSSAGQQSPIAAGISTRAIKTFPTRSVASRAKRPGVRADFIARLSEGSTVYHPRFGSGCIEETGRAGKFTRAVINFDEVGRKIMMLEYADLSRPSTTENSS